MNFKIIIDKPRSARFNMNADLYFLRRSIEDECAYLRLYSWEKPTVTIGRMQTTERILKMKEVNRRGFEVIRRPTGGRAVLHVNDITYCITFPKTLYGLFGSSIEESYAIVSFAFSDFLASVGVFSQQARFSPNINSLRRNVKLPCFIAPNRNETLINGRKLIGSSQKRTRDGVLQHGSIPLDKSYLDIMELLDIEENEKDRQISVLRSESISLSEVASVGFKDAVEKIVDSFQKKFGGTVVDFPLEFENEINNSIISTR